MDKDRERQSNIVKKYDRKRKEEWERKERKGMI